MSRVAGPREITLAPSGIEEVRSLFENELRHRRVFVGGQTDLVERERCTLVIVHPAGKKISVAAEAVYIRRDEPGSGVGFDLTGLDAEKFKELELFVEEPRVEQSNTTAASRNIYERIRQLGLREREQVARQGVLSDRVALERVYGSSVWEALLQNPQLTVPEVAHVAKNGTLPVPLAAVIVANGAWIASGEVRRALLSNPRVAGAHLDRVLRAMPKIELKQLASTSPYRPQVRAAAKKLLGE